MGYKRLVPRLFTLCLYLLACRWCSTHCKVITRRQRWPLLHSSCKWYSRYTSAAAAKSQALRYQTLLLTPVEHQRPIIFSFAVLHFPYTPAIMTSSLSKTSQLLTPSLSILQACRGLVDVWVPPYISLALQKLATCSSRKLKDNLVLVVANALYYNPVLTLQALHAQGAVQQFLGGWFSMIMSNKSNGKPKHFKRIQQKKV